MNIFSWRGGGLPVQVGRTLIREILRAEGPVVLPLNEESVRVAAKFARKPSYVRQLVEKDFHLRDLCGLATYVMSQGKVVLPLFDAEHERIARRHLSADFWRLPSEVDVTAYMRNQVFEAEARQMLHHFERFRANPPALLFAEDNHAIVLGKLFRRKVMWLTKPSTVFGEPRQTAKKTFRKIMEIMRGRPKPKKRR